MNTVTMFEVAPRVAAGATFLDQKFPLGWVSRRMLETLDVSDPGLCALGQLFGDFEKGGRVLQLTDEQEVAYGFYPSLGDSFGGTSMKETIAEYELLTKAWKAEIESRLRQPAYMRHIQGRPPTTVPWFRHILQNFALFPA